MKWIKGTLVFIGLVVIWGAVSAYGGLSGWWLSSVAPSGDRQAFVSVIEEKMIASHQGSIAVVLLEDGSVIYEKFSTEKEAIDENTVFPLASMSKFFSAYGVIQLANAGKISLDQPITDYLTRWQLPKSEFDNSKVTIRQLLSHTAGLTDGLGFGDYQAEETVPSLEASLSNPRASQGTKTIVVGKEPGTEWAYSGGGYLILELIIEEVSGMSFSDWMQQTVFNPLEMKQSSYHYLGDLSHVATSYDKSGNPAPYYRYASNAATGLSASAADLTLFAKALINQVHQASTKTLREPLGYTAGAAIWGAGAMLYAPTTGGDVVFGHDGSNDPAINSTLRINPDNGDAIIVLTTGGDHLASALAYEWTLWQTGYPDFLSFNKALASTVLPTGIGAFFILLGVIVMFRRKQK